VVSLPSVVWLGIPGMGDQHSMPLLVCLLTLLAFIKPGVAFQYIFFDDATASSVYSTGSAEGQPVFAASNANSPSAGYWCSSGKHSAEEVVSWTGILGVGRKALGIKVSWSYSPGEFKVLVSSDGANFMEAQCWQPSSRDDVSFVEHVMFEAPVPVRVVTLVTRSRKAWGYVGLDSVLLIAAPAPAMFVSGATSPTGPLCLVGDGGLGHVSLAPCFDAIAAGTGRDIFTLSDSGALFSVVRPDQCLALADGDAERGGLLELSSCRVAMAAGDGRAFFESSASGQLRFARMGGYCLSAKGDLMVREVASGATVVATSSQGAHPAGNVVDGGGQSTYWASASAPSGEGAVDLTFDFGVAANIASIEITWEFPAKAFELQAGSGGPFATMFATSTNSMGKTVFAAEGERCRFLRVRMLEPQAVGGIASEHPAYGISEVRVMASTASLVAQDCGEAGGSSDARDKFIMVAVPEFDPSFAGSALSSAELALKSADRLGGLLAQLQVALHTLESCALTRRKTCTGNNCTVAKQAATLTQAHLRAQGIGGLDANEDLSPWAQISCAITSQLGIDRVGVTVLMENARAVISTLRRTL